MRGGGTLQFSSVAQSCPTLCDPMNHSTPGLPVHHQLPESTQTHVHRVGDAIQPSHPLSSPSLPAPNPSQHHSSNESTLRMRWPKCWSFSFSVIPSKEISGLFSFRMDWLDLPVVQFSSVAQSCPTLCDPMNRSTPGPPVHHQLPKFTQTHVHWHSDAIQPSHPLSSPSPPAPNPSQHQSLFQ